MRKDIIMPLVLTVMAVCLAGAPTAAKDLSSIGAVIDQIGSKVQTLHQDKSAD